MKYTAIASLLVAIVAADTINELVDQIPTCAVTCIRDQGKAVGCDITDFACSCGKVTQLTPKVVSCLATSGCSTADQAKVFQVSPQICAQITGGGSQPTATSTSDGAGAGTEPTVTSTTAPGAAGKVQAAGWAGIIAAAALAL